MNVVRGARHTGPLGPLLLALLLTACRQPAPSCPDRAPSPVEGSAPFGQIWVGTRINVEGITQIDPQVAHPFFNVPNSYVIEGWDMWPWTVSSKRTASWASAAEFEEDVRAEGGSLRGVQAVLYDPEAWQATPRDEQRDPEAAMRRFAGLARSLGYEVIITPGLTLAGVQDSICPRVGEESPQDTYLRCDVAGTAARYADVVEVQAQTLQGDPGAYRDFVAAAAADARAANPNVKVISGLRARDDMNIDEEKRAWLATLDTMDGHYLAMEPADAAELLGWISACASG